MPIPLTIASLALVTGTMILVRGFWGQFPARLRFVLIRMSIAFVILQVFFAATKWGTTSDLVNVLVNWLAIAAYELLVLLFSRLPPRWLTSICAVILLIPVFASTILFPLTELFNPYTSKKVSINHHFFYEIKPWSNAGSGTDGVDLLISYRPSFAPFLRRKIQPIPFNNHECHAMAATATLSADAKTVLGHCPRWPSEPAGTVDRTLRLP
jgi:hypothetical protein